MNGLGEGSAAAATSGVHRNLVARSRTGNADEARRALRRARIVEQAVQRHGRGRRAGDGNGPAVVQRGRGERAGADEVERPHGRGRRDRAGNEPVVELAQFEPGSGSRIGHRDLAQGMRKDGFLPYRLARTSGITGIACRGDSRPIFIFVPAMKLAFAWK